MKAAQMYLLLHLLLNASVHVDTLNPFSFISRWISFETCDSNWISFNTQGLKADLDGKLIGQHIAKPIILKAVKGFMSNDNPEKPLVLSLHGPSGTGKNFLTKLIAENIYKKGMDSSFVHVFVSSLHFPHSSSIDFYKSLLQQQIKDSVTKCERSMFIFDEMDQMPLGLIDSIMPYLDCYNKLDGVSYRKAIFIFLSNAGQDIIINTTLNFWQEGRDREEIELKDLEHEMPQSAFNSNNGGFWHSRLIEKNMVDFFIPFLPLEYQHVIQCILAEMKGKEDSDVANKIARDLQYSPKFQRVFSVKGCKTVKNRLSFYT